MEAPRRQKGLVAAGVIKMVKKTVLVLIIGGLLLSPSTGCAGMKSPGTGTVMAVMAATPGFGDWAVWRLARPLWPRRCNRLLLRRSRWCTLNRNLCGMCTNRVWPRRCADGNGTCLTVTEEPCLISMASL